MKNIRVSIGTERIVDIPPSAWPSEDQGWALEKMLLAAHFTRYVTEDAKTWLEFRLYSVPVDVGHASAPESEA